MSNTCIAVNGFHATFLEEPFLLSDCFLFDANDTLCDPAAFVIADKDTTYTGKSILMKYPNPRIGAYASIDHVCRDASVQQIRLPVGNPNQTTIVSLVTGLLPVLAFIIIITSPDLKI